jgi:hypothetical protein
MHAPDGPKAPIDRDAASAEIGVGRGAVFVEDGYLLVRWGPHFVEYDNPDREDIAAVDHFMKIGLETGIDRVIFDNKDSSHGFGLNAFRMFAECHQRTGYRISRCAVVSKAIAESVRIQLSRVELVGQSGNPEVRLFRELADAVLWITSDPA